MEITSRHFADDSLQLLFGTHADETNPVQHALSLVCLIDNVECELDSHCVYQEPQEPDRTQFKGEL